MSAGAGIRPRIFEDEDALARAAADFFLSSARRRASRESGRFVVALSGGQTPSSFYRLLGSEPYRSSIDWQYIHLFWADERMVPANHPESNFKLAFDTFLSRVPVPDRNIHRILADKSPDEAAREYESGLRSFFASPLPVFDLIILGVGIDGHTASLLPGTAALSEQTRLAVPVFAGNRELNRVTLTLPVLNNAENILFLASGQAKAEIIAELFAGNDRKKQYPAGLVSPVHGRLTWLIDEDAAKKLASTNRDRDE